MIEKIIWILQNFSGFRFGLYADFYIENGLDAFEPFAILLLIVAVVITIGNIYHFIDEAPFTLRTALVGMIYIIFNNITLLLAALIGITIGAYVGFIIIGFLWIVFVAANAFAGDEESSIFGILDWAIRYLNDYEAWKARNINWQEHYNRKLNI